MGANHLWYKNAVFYEVYVQAFYDSNGDGRGDLPGLIQKLDYLQTLGVDCIWLLPIYASPLCDDGYDISDYYRINEVYGSLDDFRALLEAAHARGIRVITDLVLNHTSDQHPWFQSARQGRDSPYHDYYVWSDDDRKYSQARIIFLDTEKSNWSWDDHARRYYWHRFYACQPDLNYDNPAVREEMKRVVKFWLDIGIDGFRVDAVPYLFEREGTNCENLPETHAYLKELREFVDQNYADRILLCEANQWPEDVRAYFGDGDEFHMGFHFPLMPRIFMALRKGMIDPLVWVMERTPAIPDGCQWCTFLRNHDELTLEMVTEEERQWMWEQYAPEPRMRLNLGIRRRLAPLLDNDQRKIKLAYSLLFTLPGSPIIYYGDEIGMGDNIYLKDRDGLRTPMQWERSSKAGFSTADPSLFYLPLISTEEYAPERVNVVDQINNPASLWNSLKRMIRIRKDHPAFGLGDFAWEEGVQGQNRCVAAYWRRHLGQRYLILNNLTPTRQVFWVKQEIGTLSGFINLLGEPASFVKEGGNLGFILRAYEYRWLKVD